MRKTSALIAVLVLACVLAQPRRSAGEDVPQPDGKTARPSYVLKVGNPAEHGLKPEDLAAIRAILRKAVDDKSINGDSLLIAHKGEVIFREGFGRILPDDILKLASSSKPIAATAVMQMVDAGKLTLEDTVTKFVPEFKGTRGENATIRQLLCHTAGMPVLYPGGRPTAGTMSDFARLIAFQGDLSEPGKFKYSGVGIDLACCCAEVAAGMSFESYIRANLFEPLGMKHTSFTLGADGSTVPKEASERGEGRYVSCGGGMSSTLDDVAAFYQMHLNGGTYGDKRILSEKSIAEMHRRQSANSAKADDPYGGDEYGLGFYRDRITKDGEALNISHGGALGTFPWMDSDRELVCVFFSQTRLGTVKAVIAELQKKIRALIPSDRDKDVVKQAADNPGPELGEGDPSIAKGLRQVFSKVSGGAETISREQFAAFLKERFGENMRPQIIDRLFDKIDADRNGALTLDEFTKLADIFKALRGAKQRKDNGPDDIDGEE